MGPAPVPRWLTLWSLPLLLAASLAPAASAAAPPAPYSLPWQLRPTAAANVVRSDTALAFSSAEATGARFTLPTLLLASWKLNQLVPMVRLGFVRNWPGAGPDGQALLNPVVGGTWVQPLSEELRLAFFLGLTVPVGTGGGDSPYPGDAAALQAGIRARSALDNAMFAVDFFTVLPGVDLSYVAHGLTVQVEATVQQGTRVRGDAVQVDAFRTNFTSGLHVGFFLFPFLSVGGELRYQRWLSTPAAVALAPATRDTLTVAVGPRVHWKLSEVVTLRPGIALALPLDAPMTTENYVIIQVDVPVVLF